MKYIAVTLMASKLQVFKVRPGQDLNPAHLRESISLCLKCLKKQVSSNENGFQRLLVQVEMPSCLVQNHSTSEIRVT